MSDVLFTHGIRINEAKPGTISLAYIDVIEGRLATPEEVEAAKERERRDIERSKPYSSYYEGKLSELEDPDRIMFSPSGDGRVWARVPSEVFTDRELADKDVEERRRKLAEAFKGSFSGDDDG